MLQDKLQPVKRLLTDNTSHLVQLAVIVASYGVVYQVGHRRGARWGGKYIIGVLEGRIDPNAYER